MTRGDILRLPAPRRARGHEQRGARYGVVVQADELAALSTVTLAPTSRSARPASFRPAVAIEGAPTQVLVEQIRAVDRERLKEPVGRLNAEELEAVDAALLAVLDLGRP